MDGYYYYSNPGAILRRIFPKQLNTQALIIIWVVIFIINIVLVVLVQNFGIYNITDFSKEGLQTLSYFEDCEILTVNKTADTSQANAHYCVRYKNAEGETHLVYLDMFPASIFERARLRKSTDILLDENGLVLYDNGKEVISMSQRDYFEETHPENFFTTFLEFNVMQRLAGIYISIGAVMLLFEFFLYGVFRKLVR